MNRSYLLTAMLMTVAVTIVLSGCGGSGGPTLATVGDYDITAEEFGQYASIDGLAFATAQEEFDKKRELLDSLIVTRLLIQAAYDKGIDQSEELARVVLANKDKFLLSALARQEVTDKAVANEAEIQEYWEHLDTRIRAWHIVVSDADTAQALFERIKQGESFEKLAYEYSIDPSAKKNKGDLGYFAWGSVVDEFQEVAFQMETGELSPPVKSILGYHIIKLIDRVPNDQRAPLDEMRGEIERQIIARKRFINQKKFLDRIQNEYPVTVDTTICQYLLHKREEMYPPMLLETLPRNGFDVEQLDRDEKELVIATWEGGQMTVQEYLEEIQQLQADLRPDLDDYDSLAAIVHAMTRADMLITEAHRRGLDNDPEFLQKLKLFKELTMADLMMTDSLPQPAAVDQGQVRQYYDEHPEEFTTPAKVHVYEILLSDELKAKDLKKRLRTLSAFQEKALELSERSGKRALKGDLGYITHRLYPELFDVAHETPIGTIGGPVVTAGKYSIFWVEDKIEPELKDFLGSQRDIFQKLTAQNRREAFAAWVDECKQTVGVQVNEDALWETIDVDKYVGAGGDASDG